jgi:ABC-2 type transport system permease protein
MSNVIAIARKELRSYFTSPIGAVMIGFFALIYGYFFYALLEYFQRSAMQMGLGQAPVDLNDQMIRPLFGNVSVILLFALPLITMRTYAEEKRSGTIELLLTSPLTDLQIVLGKFLGAMGLIAAMLAITLPHMAVLFWYADPQWKPLVTTYLGFFLMAACFVAVGLFVSSITRNQIIAGMATFAVFLLLWVIDWMAEFSSGNVREVIEYLSITRHFDDFSKGVLDTTHIVYYLSVIIFGLVLTIRSVEMERGRA